MPTAFITVNFVVLTIAAAENRHVANVDIPGAYLNASMKSIVVYLCFRPTPATMLCELVPGYKKFFIKDGRIMVELDKELHGCVELAKL